MLPNIAKNFQVELIYGSGCLGVVTGAVCNAEIGCTIDNA